MVWCGFGKLQLNHTRYAENVRTKRVKRETAERSNVYNLHTRVISSATAAPAGRHASKYFSISHCRYNTVSCYFQWSAVFYSLWFFIYSYFQNENQDFSQSTKETGRLYFVIQFNFSNICLMFIYINFM